MLEPGDICLSDRGRDVLDWLWVYYADGARDVSGLQWVNYHGVPVIGMCRDDKQSYRCGWVNKDEM